MWEYVSINYKDHVCILHASRDRACFFLDVVDDPWRVVLKVTMAGIGRNLFDLRFMMKEQLKAISNLSPTSRIIIKACSVGCRKPLFG